MRAFANAAIALVLCGVGCKEPPGLDTGNWSEPKVISMTLDGTGSSFSLYRWNNSILAMNSDAGRLLVFILQPEGKTWEEKVNPPSEWLPLDVSPSENLFLASKGLLHKNELTVSFFVGQIASSGRLTVTKKSIWVADKARFFDRSADNVFFEAWNSGPVPQPFWGGLMLGDDLYVPYCIRGATLINGALVAAEGPFDNGVFFSLNSGTTWQRESIDTRFADSSQVSKTDKYFYFTSGRTEAHELWYSRKPLDDGTWSPPATLTKHFARRDSAVTSGDTIHLCWLDRRHEKRRANAFYPWRENYEVAYSHRKDSDADWSEETMLSEGLLYAYEPKISVEGNKLVVVWAGVQHDNDGHHADSPNDVFYVVSKDGGETWTRPMKVTDGVEKGLTAGMPQVALLNGVIHLFYAQGKMRLTEESGGLTLLNQSPWPIYYTQRPFPE
jgi:hypothetical protein